MCVLNASFDYQFENIMKIETVVNFDFCPNIEFQCRNVILVTNFLT